MGTSRPPPSIANTPWVSLHTHNTTAQPPSARFALWQGLSNHHSSLDSREARDARRTHSPALASHRTDPAGRA